MGAVLLNEDKILAAKRAEGRTLGGMWEFPGGKVEKGETPQAALKRELAEEFSDQITVGPQAAKTAVYEYKFGIIHLTVYYARLLTRNFKLIAHSRIRWVSQTELTSLEWAPADWPIIWELEHTDLKQVKFYD